MKNRVEKQKMREPGQLPQKSNVCTISKFYIGSFVVALMLSQNVCYFSTKNLLWKKSAVLNLNSKEFVHGYSETKNAFLHESVFNSACQELKAANTIANAVQRVVNVLEIGESVP